VRERERREREGERETEFDKELMNNSSSKCESINSYKNLLKTKTPRDQKVIFQLANT
jgi:hypothetical protein